MKKAILLRLNSRETQYLNKVSKKLELSKNTIMALIIQKLSHEDKRSPDTVFDILKNLEKEKK